MQGGMIKWRFLFTNISLYLRNGYSQMGTCSETICKHRILFSSIQHLAWLPRGRPQEKQKCGKIAIFGLTHWLKHRITRKLLKIEVHAARGLASIELSFHPCNILCDNHRGVSRGNKNVGWGRPTWKRRFFALAVRLNVFIFYTYCFLVCLLHYVCDFIYITCVLFPVLLVLALSRS